MGGLNRADRCYDRYQYSLTLFPLNMPEQEQGRKERPQEQAPWQKGGPDVGDTATDAQYAAFTENGFAAKGSWLQQGSVPKSFGAVDTDAQGINNRDVILGMYDVRSTPSQLTDGEHGFLLDERGFHKLPDPDFTIYDRRPAWNGINAEGAIVGIAFNLSTFNDDAFILENGKYTYYRGNQI